MSWSMYTADRATHLKIVVMGLAGAVLISMIGISAHEFNFGTDVLSVQAPTLSKATTQVEFSAANTDMTIR